MRLQDFAAGPYRRLPRQVCHNDVTPNNVLVNAGRVTAVLDFEFATPAARALDFATSLRTILPFWEEAEPWAAVRPFCRGYARWMRLTEAEVAALPRLLRLRGAITVLWWIGRAAAGSAGLVPDRIANLQALIRWLEHAEHRLVEMVMREVVR